MTLRLLLSSVLFASLTACQLSRETPEVEAVYPSADVLPENLLRMYVQFSKPMKTVGNLERIKLIDEEGNELKYVFFNNVYELWNHEQTRLTLLLDPARVKSGLLANETIGRAKKPGKKYKLVKEALEAVNHKKMQVPFEKWIWIETADLLKPDIKRWKLVKPKANTRESFAIHFPQMLDLNSLQQRLAITDSESKPVQGTIVIEKQETEWRFQPEKPWRHGSYILHVNTRLEDPSGNNVNGLFDHKIGTLSIKKEGEIVRTLFNIKNNE